MHNSIPIFTYILYHAYSSIPVYFYDGVFFLHMVLGKPHMPHHQEEALFFDNFAGQWRGSLICGCWTLNMVGWLFGWLVGCCCPTKSRLFNESHGAN